MSHIEDYDTRPIRVLHVEDDADAAVVIDCLAAAEIVCVDCHKSLFFSVVFNPGWGAWSLGEDGLKSSLDFEISGCLN